MAHNNVQLGRTCRWRGDQFNCWIWVLLINEVFFKKGNTNKTYLYCARSKPQQKPTSSGNKYNNNDYNKNRNFSATFRHLCRQLFDNSLPNLWLSLPSNGSWTRHCIFWKMNLVLYYNSCQFRLINKTLQQTVSCMNSNLFFH